MPPSRSEQGYGKLQVYEPDARQLIVHKTTIPAGSQQTFSVTGSSSDGGLFFGGNTGTVSDTQDATFTIQQNKTYSVEEMVLAGWTETSNTCKDLKVNGSTLVNGVRGRMYYHEHAECQHHYSEAGESRR